MKKVLSIILLAGMLSGPMYAASVQDVAALAAKTDVTIDTLSVAVYEAVKASPQSAVEVFETVMKQRSTWSVTETYAVLRAVLLAAPSLESSFVQAATGSRSAADAQGLVLLNALYAQAGSAASAVVQGVVGSSAAVAGNGVSAAALNAYVPTPPTVTPSAPEYTVTPTPPMTSVNN